MPVVRVLGTLLAVGCLAGFLGACGSSSRGGGGAGVAQRGTYKVGDEVVVLPSGFTSTIASIDTADGPV